GTANGRLKPRTTSACRRTRQECPGRILLEGKDLTPEAQRTPRKNGMTRRPGGRAPHQPGVFPSLLASVLSVPLWCFFWHDMSVKQIKLSSQGPAHPADVQDRNNPVPGSRAFYRMTGSRYTVALLTGACLAWCTVKRGSR